MRRSKPRFDNPSDEAYFKWLANLVMDDDDDPCHTHWCLLAELHKRPYYYSIPMDANRAQDGRDLRKDYLDENGVASFGWTNQPCTFLEMLIALADRIDRMVGDDDTPAFYYFWMMLENLGLVLYADDNFDGFAIVEIEESVRKVNEHSYSRLGDGGLFPLYREASVGDQHDVRKMELWDQFAAYYEQRMA